jgi:7,8-dihydropterin-6-yl-methyl-4-(beta-D-ribofuranosyl)aminobenzene 5'-phosphate synthase
MADDVLITLLVENSVHRTGLRAEHGLAWHVDFGGRQVLFDTGQTELLLANARELEMDLTRVEAIVLSHGHYDHTGGLVAVRHRAPMAPVWMHPAARAPKFAAKSDGTGRAIGMSEAAVTTLDQATVVLCDPQPVEVIKGLFATGPIPRVNTVEDVGGRFFLDAACTRADPLVDDQALFFESSDGLVVVLGCAHAGVINTLRHIESFTGSKRIAAVLGGMHLLNASEERLQFTLRELAGRDIQMLAPLHCTGWPATLRLWNTFPERCQQGGVGSVFRFRR